MLCLNRKEGELIVLTVPPSSEPQVIAVRVDSVGKTADGEKTVRLAVEADRSIGIDRQEVYLSKQRVGRRTY
jgi:sRNA-binding carbon storage regulator CsrA